MSMSPPSSSEEVCVKKDKTIMIFNRLHAVETLTLPLFTSSVEHSPLGLEQKEMSDMEAVLWKNAQELQLLQEVTGMPVSQENGQRTVGPPLGTKVIPRRGCEVFVGKLPKELNEMHIFKVFMAAGKIYQIRLMMDFCGANRGFAFVKFYNHEDAARAIIMFNHYTIVPGRKIGVTMSVDNCRLFIGGIPKEATEKAIFHDLALATEHLVRVYCRLKPGSMENRGYAFAEYRTHRDAAMARRKMLPGKIQVCGRGVHVDWAEPDEIGCAHHSKGNRRRSLIQPVY